VTQSFRKATQQLITTQLQPTIDCIIFIINPASFLCIYVKKSPKVNRDFFLSSAEEKALFVFKKSH